MLDYMDSIFTRRLSHGSSVSAVPTSYHAIAADDTKATLLVDALAWAVSRKMPLAETLKTLPFYRPHAVRLSKPVAVINWLRGPLSFSLITRWLNDVSWSSRVLRLIRDLESGSSLGNALRRRFKRNLPAFYIEGVVRAEADGALETALPLLAQNMSSSDSLLTLAKADIMVTFVRLLACATTMLFIATMIAPRIAEIMEEIGGIPGYKFPLHRFEWAAYFGISMWLLFSCWMLALRFPVVTSRVLSYVPVVGYSFRRTESAALARGMAGYLAQGVDVLTAAQWCQQAAYNGWIKKRLQAFIDQVSRGMSWAVAWGAMEHCPPAHSWLLQNAAAREVPAEGFARLAEWQAENVAKNFRWIAKLIDPVGTLVVGAFVAQISFEVFRVLSLIIESLL